MYSMNESSFNTGMYDTLLKGHVDSVDTGFFTFTNRKFSHDNHALLINLFQMLNNLIVVQRLQLKSIMIL